MTAATAYDIRQEQFNIVRRELEPLFAEHQRELTVDVGVPAKPDLKALLGLQLAGALHVTVGRHEGKVVGYILWTLSTTNVEFAGTPTAAQGPWFVSPEHRASTLGLSLFRVSLTELRARGIVLAEPHYYETGGAGVRLGRWFESLGAVPVMRTYLLNLKEAL